MIRRALLAALPVALAAPAVRAEEPATGSFDLGEGQGGPWRIALAPPRGPAPPGGHPSLLLLDGTTTFPLALRAREAAGAGEIALIAVGQPGPGRPDPARRAAELAPPAPADAAARGDGTGPTARDGFLAFLDAALPRALDAHLPLDPARRTLYGHSLSALLGLHILLTRPDAFAAYVLADPSIWWNRRAVLDEQAAFLAGIRAAGGRLAHPLRVHLVASGRSTGPENAARLAPPSTRETAAALAAVPGLHATFRPMPEETHGSILPPSVADAVLLAAGREPAIP